MGANSKCKSCLLPAAAPNANIGSSSTCQFCLEDTELLSERSEVRRNRYEADLEIALEDCRGKGEFDCLVNLSGGKDSCLLLHRLKREYGLNVLAFTTDMNVPEIAWENIRRTIELLDVPLITYRPPTEFYKKMFRFLLANQEARGAVRTVCYVCAPLFEGYSLKLAMEKNIPLVLAGYAPGQPEPDRMEYEFSRSLMCETDWTPPELVESGLFSETELELFWNPLKYPEDTTFPRYLAPFHAWEYSQEEAMNLVVELGLIKNKKSANPIHSNCPINWLLMYSDLKHLGFNPYAPEFSKLIREGKANRNYWAIMTPLVNFMIRKKILLGNNVRKSLTWLGMKEDELAITRAQQGEDYSDQILQSEDFQLVNLQHDNARQTRVKTEGSDSKKKATAIDLFRRTLDQRPDSPAIGIRHDDAWMTLSWREYGHRSLVIAGRLRDAGVKQGDRVAIRGPSDGGWSIAECAVLCLGAAVVGVDAYSHLHRTQAALAAVNAQAMIAVGELDEHAVELSREIEVINITSDGRLVDGDEATPLSFDSLPKIEASELATIVFTSGTTGEPKGVAFTHGQVMLAINEISSEFPLFNKGDSVISWLPMNHLFQRVMNYVAVQQGAVIYFEPNPGRVVDTAREVSPRILFAVPRFLEKLSEHLQAQIVKMPWVLRKIVNNSMRQDHRNSWQKFFARQASARARDALGGKLKYIVTGSAALRVDVAETLEFFGFDVLEAYGTSENIVPIAANRPGQAKNGTVGKPFPSNEVRIAADGEIQVRGPGCIQRYWNESNDVVDAEGFYATGDLGHFDSQGYLKISGRKSSQFKTATGRKINPEWIEGVYRKSAFIDDIVVCGESRKFIVGLIVPSQTFVEACRTRVPDAEAKLDLLQSEAARLIMREKLSEFEEQLEKFERIADFQILPRPFDPARGELTSSLKKRRHAIEESFRSDIDVMFEQHSETKSAAQKAL